MKNSKKKSFRDLWRKYVSLVDGHKSRFPIKSHALFRQYNTSIVRKQQIKKIGSTCLDKFVVIDCIGFAPSSCGLFTFNAGNANRRCSQPLTYVKYVRRCVVERVHRVHANSHRRRRQWRRRRRRDHRVPTISINVDVILDSRLFYVLQPLARSI